MSVFLNAKGDLKVKKISAQSFVGPLTGSPILPTYTVAQLTAMTPSAANAGTLVRCSNGNAGDPCLAMSSGSAWLVIALGSAVAIA